MKTTKLTLGSRALAAAGVLCVLAGCGGKPQEYFRLSAVSGAPVRTSGMAVGVGPVTLPGYIDRTQLVFQSGPNEFQVPAKASWAGPLGENVTQVLADDVGRHLGSGNVLRYPWAPGAYLRYQVAVNVEQFHGISGSEAILDVSWLVEEPDSRQILSRHKVSLHEAIHGDGYAAVVDAESQLLDQLAVAVARSLGR